MSAWLSQISTRERSTNVEAQGEVINASAIDQPNDELEAIFFAHYTRLVRLISRVIRDPGRAEELAVETVLKFPVRSSISPEAQGSWLLRTGARMGLDELRRNQRRERYSRLLRVFDRVRTPEDIHKSKLEQDRVREVLGSLARRDGELLLLRATGCSYSELALVTGLKESSVGTILARAQKTFRKEYTRRFGDGNES